MVDDFIHNLRTGNTRRYDRNRRYDGGNQYPNGDKRRPKDGKLPVRRMSLDADQFVVIKNALESVAEAFQQQANAAKRRAAAKESIAESMKSIAGFLESRQASDILDALKRLADNDQTGMQASLNADRDKVMSIIQELRDRNISYEKIALHLENEGIPTFSGKGQWRGQTIHRLHQRLQTANS